MPDYNIYLRADLKTGENSPTKPNQIKDKKNKVSPKKVAGMVSSFIQNPDSAIGFTLSKAAGTISKAAGTGAAGAALVIGVAAVKITDKVITMYNNYASSASGDYAFQIQYGNFKQTIHNVLHPFSTEVNRQYSQLEIRKQNSVNEQRLLLTGGSILNSEYGRFL